MKDKEQQTRLNTYNYQQDVLGLVSKTSVLTLISPIKLTNDKLIECRLGPDS